MQENWTHKGRILYKSGVVFKEMPAVILETVVSPQSIVVLTESTPATGERNVYCLDFKGGMLWQVPQPVAIHEENQFTGIYYRGNALFAYSVSGVEYRLNPDTGIVLESQLIR